MYTTYPQYHYFNHKWNNKCPVQSIRYSNMVYCWWYCWNKGWWFWSTADTAIMYYIHDASDWHSHTMRWARCHGSQVICSKSITSAQSNVNRELSWCCTIRDVIQDDSFCGGSKPPTLVPTIPPTINHIWITYGMNGMFSILFIIEVMVIWGERGVHK